MALRIKLEKLKQIVTYFSEFSEEVSVNVDVGDGLMYIFAALGGSVNIWTIIPLSASVVYDGEVSRVFNVPVLKVKACLCSFHPDSVVCLEPDLEDNVVRLSSHHVVSVDCDNEPVAHRTNTSICLGINQRKSYVFNFRRYEEKCCGRTIVNLDLLLGFIKCINQYQYITVCFRDKKMILHTPGKIDNFFREYSMTEWAAELERFSFKIPISSINKLRGFKKRVVMFEARVVMDADDNIIGMLFTDRVGFYRVNVFMSFQDRCLSCD
ncbi:late transcription factor VLTF-1-like protein [Seal parapoxvirus]|uniref:Late transcription factor 1 n=1 Tax=Seal parapoxvirus TaxID=187984 RepID=A0A1Z3GCV7_9POXV|nr:late transcription factor VLTF-1-like protein [Seal parapoxvirus]ASC55594.1 late transcription factor VLTF-1-like protein [Seal parapoxvirus]